MTGRAALAVIVTLQTIATTAYAGNPAILSTTRELARQGLEAFDAGRMDEAVEKLSRAYAVVHLPTLAVATARALAKKGKLVAASELYLEATHIPREKSWQPTQEEAQRDAEKERATLLPRIPRLGLVIIGATATDVTVSIDDVTVPQALIEAEQIVDPGEHHIEGAHGNELNKQNIVLKEGERARVTLAFSQPESTSAATTATGKGLQKGVAIGPTTSTISPPTTSNRAHGSSQRVLGWTSLAAGGAGVAVGAVAGLFAMSKHTALLDSNHCDTDKVSCTQAEAGNVDTFNRARAISMVGFIAGGVLAATGVTLILTTQNGDSKPSMAIWLGPSGASLFGGF